MIREILFFGAIATHFTTLLLLVLFAFVKEQYFQSMLLVSIVVGISALVVFRALDMWE